MAILRDSRLAVIAVLGDGRRIPGPSLRSPLSDGCLVVISRVLIHRGSIVLVAVLADRQRTTITILHRGSRVIITPLGNLGIVDNTALGQVGRVVHPWLTYRGRVALTILRNGGSFIARIALVNAGAVVIVRVSPSALVNGGIVGGRTGMLVDAGTIPLG